MQNLTKTVEEYETHPDFAEARATAEVFAVCVDNGLAYEQSEASRIAFYEAGKRSFEHYQKTGLHVTHDEIKKWTDSIGTIAELPPPTPHI